MDEEMKKLNTEKIHGQMFMGSAHSSHNSIITIECITHFSGALFHTYKVSKKKKNGRSLMTSCVKAGTGNQFEM